MVSIIDRRLNPKDKNLENRRRVIQRSKEQIKKSVKDAINNGDIKDLNEGKIKVPVRGLDEPSFGNDSNSGNRQHVIPGNKDFIEGDSIPKPQSGKDGKGGDPSDSGEGEDNFSFILTKDEFYDFFFEELELPDLAKKQMKDVTKVIPKRSGYTNVGNPATLDLRKTMCKSIGRRIGLNRPKTDELHELEEEAQRLKKEGKFDEYQEIINKIEAIKRRLKAIPWIDPSDVLYRNFTQQPQPSCQAVVFALMDVSGSMTEREKDIAKRAYLLLYMFLTRKYENVEIVFIRHHSTAEEVDEHTFFYDRVTGGTVVSTGIKLINEIIKERYPVDQWNIYVMQCSDGDNFGSDNAACINELEILLPKTQYYAYLDIMPEKTTDIYTFRLTAESELYRMFKGIVNDYENLNIKQIDNKNAIWSVFKELFGKDKK